MYTTNAVEATRVNGGAVVPTGVGLILPSNLSVKRLKAPLEVTTEGGNQIVIVDPPDVVNFSVEEFVDIALKLYGVVKSSSGGGGTGSGSGNGGTGSGGGGTGDSGGDGGKMKVVIEKNKITVTFD